jgi:NTP pyrophosphatase (non-canonical NTP hydrolase)
LTDFLDHLRIVNSARLKAWEGDNKADPLFHATELGGEVGELLNVAKKLHREAMGWRGSRATIQDLADEIGDVLICLDKLAAQYGIDIAEATSAKFDKTSAKVGLPFTLTGRKAA